MPGVDPDLFPRLRKNDKGIDTFKIHGMKHGLPLGLFAGAGIPPEQLRQQPLANFDDIATASWEPNARMTIQNEDGLCG